MCSFLSVFGSLFCFSPPTRLLCSSDGSGLSNGIWIICIFHQCRCFSLRMFVTQAAMCSSRHFAPASCILLKSVLMNHGEILFHRHVVILIINSWTLHHMLYSVSSTQHIGRPEDSKPVATELEPLPQSQQLVSSESLPFKAQSELAKCMKCLIRVWLLYIP